MSLEYMGSSMSSSQHSRNVKAVRITGSLLLSIIKTSRPRVISCDGVPADAKIVRLGYELETDTIIAVYEHPSFPICNEGRRPEELRPSFTEAFGEAAIEALKI